MSKSHILIGVTGGIAAYKVVELIRLLRDQGHTVQIVMTEQAKQFITPLTLQTLSGRSVYSDLFDAHFENAIGHIQLARWADVILIAPASAHVIARLAHGLADDLLSTLCLASAAPLLIAPAMNKQMWDNPATQANITLLKNRGVTFIGPDSGEQACGEIGMGRMAETEELAETLNNFLNLPLFAGKKVLITAGPTQEAIDPVRYISTRSSGIMGYAIAEVFAHFGAEVHLISGPSTLPCPHQVHKIAVTSTEEMYQATCQQLPVDIFVGAAAVTDYRAETPSTFKIKRGVDEYSLKLVKNPDILAAVKKISPKSFLVGFAAETNDHLRHAQEKLHKKSVDMLLLNAVENGQGFGAVSSSMTVLTADGEVQQWPELSKPAIARRLLELIAQKIGVIPAIDHCSLSDDSENRLVIQTEG